MSTPAARTILEADWRAKARELFGEDKRQARFECAGCGLVMSQALAAERFPDKAEQLESWRVHQECIGRHIPGVGCNWAAYGMLSGPVFVVVEEFEALRPVFDFEGRPLAPNPLLTNQPPLTPNAGEGTRDATAPAEAPGFGAFVDRALAELTPEAATEAAADLDGSGADGPDDVVDFVMAGLSERVADFRAAGVRAQSEARAELRAYLATAALLLVSAAAEMDRHAAETGFCRKGREPFTVDDVRPCCECDATAEVTIDEDVGVCLACFRRFHAELCGCPAPVAPDDPPKSQMFFVFEARRRDGGSFEDAMRASVEPYRAYLAAKEGAT